MSGYGLCVMGASQKREGKRKESSRYWRNSQYFRCSIVHGENIVSGVREEKQ